MGRTVIQNKTFNLKKKVFIVKQFSELDSNITNTKESCTFGHSIILNDDNVLFCFCCLPENSQRCRRQTFRKLIKIN